jgi:hypothetical protein
MDFTSIDCLPIEGEIAPSASSSVLQESSLTLLCDVVVHHILSYLSVHELLAVRQLTRTLNRITTVNHLWQPHVQQLIHARPILSDLRQILPTAWSFSHAADGWFRAYLNILQTAKSDWVPTEDNIKNTSWTVHFIGMDLVREIPEQPQSIARFESDGMVHTVAGHLLESNKWWIVNETVRGKVPTQRRPLWVFANNGFEVLGYPPLKPSRDIYTWGRILKHIQVLMLSTAPKFLENLLLLHNEILESTASITTEERTEMEKAMESSLSDIRAMEQDPSVTLSRLEELHFARRQALRLQYQIIDEPSSQTASNGFNEYEMVDFDDDEEDDMSSGSDVRCPLMIPFIRWNTPLTFDSVRLIG